MQKCLCVKLYARIRFYCDSTLFYTASSTEPCSLTCAVNMREKNTHCSPCHSWRKQKGVLAELRTRSLKSQLHNYSWETHLLHFPHLYNVNNNCWFNDFLELKWWNKSAPPTTKVCCDRYVQESKVCLFVCLF